MQGSTQLEEFYVANRHLGHVEELRLRMRADGYLFFREIVPADLLLELRDQITRILHDIGWIMGGKDRLLAKAISPALPGGAASLFRSTRPDHQAGGPA